MRTVFKILFFLCLFINAYEKTAAKEIITQGTEEITEVKAYIDKSRIVIGEKIFYKIEVNLKTSEKARFPGFKDDLGGFEVLDYGRTPRRKVGRTHYMESVWYQLVTYTVGDYIIPSLNVRIGRSGGNYDDIKTKKVFIQVKSVITGKEELKDIKSVLDVSWNIFLMLAVILIVLMIGGGLYWYFRQKRNPVKEIAAVILPHEKALQELGRIEVEDLIAKGEIKEYYYQVSNVLRNYLEERFSLNAYHQTTQEFIIDIISSDLIEGRFIEILKDYLQHCDLVKYAELKPLENVSKELICTTRKFIEETKPVGSIVEGTLKVKGIAS